MLRASLLLSLALLAFGCASTPSEASTSSDEPSETPPVEVEAEGPAPAPAPTTGPISLSPLGQSSYTVAPGTTLTWSYESHGSVGKGGSCSSSNEQVVRFVREDIEYDNPEDVEAGMSGADAGRGTVVFESVAAGSAELSCTVEFRGSVEREDSFSITVEG